jgi:hypothetical protein
MKKIVQLIPQVVADPFFQWRSLVAKYRLLLRGRQQAKVRSVSNRFIAYMKKSGSENGYFHPEPFSLTTHLNKDISINFKNYLLNENLTGSLSMSTVVSMLRNFNKIIEYGGNNGWIDSNQILISKVYCDLDSSQAGVTPYTNTEIERLMEILNKELKYIEEVASNIPYKRIVDSLKLENSNFKEALDIFENRDEFNGIYPGNIPLANRSKLQRRFYFLIHYRLNGMREFFRDIKAVSPITMAILGPIILKLSYETGLNPSSILTLDVDCLTESNALTGKPSLRFTKFRSGGSRDLHFDALNAQEEVIDLKNKQYQAVKKWIFIALKFTESVRKSAPEVIKNRLFVYKSRRGKVAPIDGCVTHLFCKSFVVKHKLKDDAGSKLRLTLVRFRSTKLNRMVNEGSDIFEVQATAVHSSIQTTINYLHLRNLEPKLTEQDKVGLQKIYRSFRIENQKASGENEKLVSVKGIFSDCLNVFDPPEDVKKLSSYRPGQACSLFNMCLTCRNVIITKHHLPVLINYYNQIKFSESYQKGELPHMHQYHRMIAVLDSILDSDKSEFSKVELEVASKVAELNRGQFIDPNIHIPHTI